MFLYKINIATFTFSFQTRPEIKTRVFLKCRAQTAVCTVLYIYQMSLINQIVDVGLISATLACSYNHTYLRESVNGHHGLLACRGAGRSRVKYLRLYVILHF
jgi:hypothetical protein